MIDRLRALVPMWLWCGAMVLTPAEKVLAQAADTTGAPSAAALETFVKAHLAVAAFRGQLQAELAEPKNKKPEIQTQLHEKLQAGTKRLLDQHELSATEFSRLTRLVSTNDAVRKDFDAAVARLSGGRGGGDGGDAH